MSYAQLGHRPRNNSRVTIPLPPPARRTTDQAKIAARRASDNHKTDSPKGHHFGAYRKEFRTKNTTVAKNPQAEIAVMTSQNNKTGLFAIGTARHAGLRAIRTGRSTPRPSIATHRNREMEGRAGTGECRAYFLTGGGPAFSTSVNRGVRQGDRGRDEGHTKEGQYQIRVRRPARGQRARTPRKSLRVARVRPTRDTRRTGPPRPAAPPHGTRGIVGGRRGYWPVPDDAPADRCAGSGPWGGFLMN